MALAWFLFKLPIAVLIAAGAILPVSIIIPPIGTAIASVWFQVAMVIGFINGRILLTILYLFILTPVALLYRLIKGGKRYFENAPTQLVERNHQFTAQDFERPY